MAPPRTFDYDLLKRLIREHPEKTYADYASELTRDARLRNRGAPAVLPATVGRAVHQYRDQWRDEGITLPARGVVNSDLAPPLGTIAPSQRMSTPLRYLREVSKQRRGNQPATEYEAAIRRQALRWAIRNQENREIVDLTDNGTVEVRPARADELDDSGNLRELAAWALPGWRPAADGRKSLRGRG